MILVLEYPKCSTCKKALKWLEENEVPFTKRHIVEENPSEQELTEWYHGCNQSAETSNIGSDN